MKIRPLILLLASILLLAFIYLTIKPKAAVAPQINSNASSAQVSAKTFNLVVKNNALVSGPATLSVTQGDTVTITITADVDGELHLHGYDQHINFKVNQPGSLTLKADITGRFPYELEDTKTEIGALEVLPK